MVGIVSGNGLGLFNSSQDILGLALGQSGLGQAKGSAQVNVATGNLSVQFLDESLSGTGADLLALRTYNSLGGVADGDADGWRWNGEKRIALVSGAAGAAGSSVRRVMGDGSETLFTWDTTRGRYLSTAGSGAHDTIAWNASGNEWVYFQDGTGAIAEWYSGSTGWIKSLRDNSGNGFDYHFTGNKLSTLKDLQSGQTFEFVYGTNGKLARLDTRTASGGALTRQVYYSYDTSNRLSSVKTDLTPGDNSIADNGVYATTYTYHGTSLRIASIAQSDGTTASFTYDASNRIATVTDQTGITTFAYDLSSRTTIVKTGNGDNWAYGYDASGRLIKVTSSIVNGVGQSSSYTYDSSGNLSSVTDGRTNKVTYTYDSNGNRTKEADSLGNTITRTFSSDSLLLTETRYSVASATAPGGAETTRYAYDTAKRLRFSVSAEGRVSENRYTPRGLVASTHQYAARSYPVSGLAVTASLSESQLNTWSSALTGTEKSQTQVTAFEYDYRGNLSKKIDYATVNTAGAGVLDNAADVTEYVYSEYGQLLQTIAVRGATRTTKTTLSSLAYDGMGRQTSAINASGTATTSYAGVNITVSNSASGLTTVSTTDSAGRLTSLKQSGNGTNRITRYYYDNAGQLRMTESPTGARSYLFYDHAGRVNARVDAAGAATVYTHDTDGRVLTETRYANPTNTSGWFNGTSVTVGKLSIGTTGTNIITNAANDRTITSTYDAAGRLLTSTRVGEASVVNTYDGASRLVKTQQGDRITNYYYDKEGRQIGTLDAEKSLTETVYDSAGRVSKTVRYEYKVSTVSDFSTMKSAVSIGPTLSTNLFYDTEGRQIGAVNEQGFLTETVYDAASNLRRVISYMTPIVVSASDTLATLKSRAGVAHTSTTHSDVFGRLSLQVAHDGTRTSYVYDTAGRLIRQIHAEGSTDQRAVRTRFNAFDEITGMVSGVGEATLVASPTAAALDIAITNYGTRYQIDGVGRKVAVFGPNGQKTFLFYNTAGQLTYTANALGEVSKTSYNSFGQVAEIRVYTSRLTPTNLASITVGGPDSLISGKVVASGTDAVISTTYSKLGSVASQTDAEGFDTTNTYNSYGQLYHSTRTIASGVTTRTLFGYDLLGRVKDTYSDYNGLRARKSTIYDGFSRVFVTLDASGRGTSTNYTDNGRTITVKDPLGRSSKIETDAYGRTVKSYDGFDRVTLYTYDDSNRKVTITSPEGISISTWKTRTGETLQVQDGKGQLTKYTYTKDGKVDRVTRHLSAADTTGVLISDSDYDNSGRLYESKDANGTITRYTYDAANRITQKTIDPSGLNIRTSYQFDGQGRQIYVTEGVGTPEASTTQYTYDRKGQIKDIIVDPANLKLRTSFSYDGVGNTVIVEKGILYGPPQKTTHYTFDALGRKTSEIVDPGNPAYGRLNLTTHYKYDKNGNLTRVIDANGNSTWFIYNVASQKSHEVDALGAVTHYEYDKNGRLHHTRQYATAIATTSFGDVVSSITLPAANVSDRRSYNVYDNIGRVKYILNAKSSTEWVVSENTYDANGNVTTLVAYDKTLTETNINTITGSTSTDGALISVSEVSTLLSSLGYSATATGNARVTRYEYDRNNRQTKTILPGWYDATDGQIYATQAAQTDRFQRTVDVTYDAAGNAVANKIRNGLSDYIYQYKTYDKADREVNDVDGLGYITQKTYDALGNLKSITRSATAVAVKTSGYWVNTDIATQTGRTIRFDYDKAGRQEKVTQANGGTTVSTYNATGGVIKQSQLLSAGVTADTYYYYDAAGRQVLTVDAEKYGTKTEYDALGNVKKVTEYALATGSALTTSSQPSFAASSKTRITTYTHDATGRVDLSYRSLYENLTTLVKVNDKNYNAFGEVVESRDAQNNLTKMEYDRLGQTSRIIEPGRVVAGTGIDVFKNQVTATPITEFTYDAYGQSIKEVRRTSAGAGATITIDHVYDLVGNEIRTKDGVGNWSNTAYDVSGKVIKQTQSVSVTGTSTDTNYSYTLERRFEYDKAGRQTAAIEVYNSGTQQTGVVNTYNGYGEVTEERKVWGAASASLASLKASGTNNVLVSSYAYSAAGQMTYKRSAEGYTYFFYDLANRVTRTEQRESSVANATTDRATVNVYDKLGRVIQQILPKSGVTTSFGSLVTSIVTPVINRTYDRWGNVLTEYGDTPVKTYQYNQDNQLLHERGTTVSMIKYDGTPVNSYVERKLNYDNLGRLQNEQQTAYGGTTASRTLASNTYNAAGQLIRTMDATGVAQAYAYDAHGNRVGSRNALLQVVVDKYDANNQLTSRALVRTSTENVVTGYTTEQVTRQVYVTVSSYGGTTQVPKTERVIVGYTTTTTPVYSQVQTGTGPYGAPIYSTVQTGTTTTQTPIYETRNVYETVTVQNPVYTLVSTDYLVNQAQYKYDQAGRKYAEGDAAGSYQYYKFDERDKITAERNRVGGVKAFTYDELGNKTAERLVFTSVYNTAPYGEPVYVTSTSTDTLRTWSYKNSANTDFVDFQSSLMQKQQVGIDPAQIYTYQYSARGQLLNEKRSSAVAVTYAYWENGLQKSITESNTVGYITSSNISELYYDRRGNRTVERNNTTETVAAHTEYAYGGTAYTVPASTTSTGNIYSYYDYDASNRLTKVKSPSTTLSISGTGHTTTNLSLLSYDYDEWGNRRRIQATYGTSTTPTKTEWYSYDAMGRVIIEGGGSSGTAATLGGGKEYAYDGAGRRVKEFVATRTHQYRSGAYGETLVGTSQIRTDRIYTYNDLQLVTNTALQQTETGYYNRVSSAAEETNTYDTRGFKTRTILNTKNRTINNIYKADGTLVTQTTTVTTGTQAGRKESFINNSYNTSGDISSYQYVAYDINRTDNREQFRNTYAYQYLTTYAGRQVRSIGVSSTQAGTAKGTTYNSYDTRGRLTSASITEAHVTDSSKTGSSFRRFSYNASGQIIAKAERRYGENTYKTQTYYYAPTGGELANLGSFGYNISPLSAVSSGGSTPGSYAVNAGDTLMGIAASLFGDAKLWYLVADANGLTQGPTDAFAPGDVGRNLRIPNSDKTISNTSTNWKPYNPSEIVGDLTPNPTILPPPAKKGCNVVAMIIMVVVAVVLTVVTAGAAAVAMGATGFGTGMAGAWAAGSAALAGGLGAGMTAVGVAASAVGGFVGSVGSQLAGKAMGAVDHFSLRQAVGSGLTAGFAAGAGSYFSGLKEGSALTTATKTANGTTVSLNGLGNAARGAVSYLGAYASNKVAGMDTHFNWTDMAVSSISSGLTGSTGEVGEMAGKQGSFGNNLASNMWGATVSSSLSRLAGRGQRQDWGAMAADAFGNALATEVVKWGSTPRAQNPAQEINSPAAIADEPSNSPKAKTETEARVVRDGLTDGGKESGEKALEAKHVAEKQKTKTEQPNTEYERNLDLTIGEDDVNQYLSIEKLNAGIGKPLTLANPIFDEREMTFSEKYDAFVGAWELGKENTRLRNDEIAIQDGGGLLTGIVAATYAPRELGFALFDAGLALGGLSKFVVDDMVPFARDIGNSISTSYKSDNMWADTKDYFGRVVGQVDNVLNYLPTDVVRVSYTNGIVNEKYMYGTDGYGISKKYADIAGAENVIRTMYNDGEVKLDLLTEYNFKGGPSKTLSIFGIPVKAQVVPGIRINTSSAAKPTASVNIDFTIPLLEKQKQKFSLEFRKRGG